MNKANLYKFEKLFNKLPWARRFALVLAIWGLIGSSWFVLVWQTLDNYQQSLQISIDKSQSLTKSYQKQLDGLLVSQATLESSSLQQEYQQLTNELNAIESRISQTNSPIVDPQKTVALFSDLLSHSKDVELVSIKNIVPIQDPQASNQAGVELYRHQIVLEVHATYEQLTDFLKNIEQLDFALSFDDLTLESISYPKVHSVLTIHFLCQRKEIIHA